MQNWQGAQSIPRDITYDAELNELVFYPIVEIEQLRGQRLYMGNATFRSVSCGYPTSASRIKQAASSQTGRIKAAHVFV